MMDRYFDWEVFGQFVCQYDDLCKDGELAAFVTAWKHGYKDQLDQDWPEFGQHVSLSRR